MRPLIALAVLCTPALGAPVPKELRKAVTFEVLLQGEWVKESSQTSNRQIWKIEGRILSVSELGTEFLSELVFNAKINPIKMDIVAREGTISRGIVKIEGQNLYLNLSKSDIRPTDFTECYVLTRAK